MTEMNTEMLLIKVKTGYQVTRADALALYQAPLEVLCAAADDIRRHYCGRQFDLCTIINGKSGKCSEDCQFCGQSAYHHTGAEEYPLLSTEKIVAQAKYSQEQGLLRYSIVTSGKRLSDPEIVKMCQAVRQIRQETDIAVCVSFGLLEEVQYKKLKDAGVTRVHNNLETSRRHFSKICTTHSFDDKVRAIQAAQAAGLTVCSGGIMGIGETPEDRIDMALALRDMGIQSIPVNLLNPISGTPCGGNRKLSNRELRRIVAVYRFLLPGASIRLAGGRGLLEDNGESCFLSGANAAISGDMLTTAGIAAAADRKLIKNLGYTVALSNE